MADSLPMNMWRMPPTATTASKPMVPSLSNSASSSKLGNNNNNNKIPMNHNNNTSNGLNTTSSTPLTVRIKRGHVSKACTNCRKMHAACDRARPCSRCVFNKLENSCIDIPRKKRVSRKKPQSPEDLSSSPQGSPQEMTIKKDHSSVGWGSDNSFDKRCDDNCSSSSSSMSRSVSTLVPSSSTSTTTTSTTNSTTTTTTTSTTPSLLPSSTSSSSSSISTPSISICSPSPTSITEASLIGDEASILSGSTADMWTDSSFLSPEPLFLSELLAEEEKRIYSTTNGPSSPPLSLSLAPLLSSRTLKQESLISTDNLSSSSSSSKQYEITYLLSEVDRLKESNMDLSSKLMNVTEELQDMKAKMQGLIQLLSNHVLNNHNNNSNNNNNHNSHCNSNIPLSIGVATPP